MTSTEPPEDAPGAELFAEIVAYIIYAGWLSAVTYAALYIQIPPLPSIQRTHGTVAAVAAGVTFLAVARALYNAIRRRISPPPPPEPEPEPEPEPAPVPKQRKRSKKKRRRQP